MNIFIEHIKEKQKKGLLDDFSPNHLILRALNGDMSYFQENEFLIANISNPLTYSMNYANTFITNLNYKLKNLEENFSEKEIDEFIANQLSAGKTNYLENQLFRALAEVNVLNYMALFSKAFSRNYNFIYEPHLGENGANPEARFKVDDIIIDVEVKTPGFPTRIVSTGINKGLVRPCGYLTVEQKEKIESIFEGENIKLLFPRIRKICDFIKSAASKFQVQSSDKHYNVLFINWTYTDIPETKFNEALSILTNTMSGLLVNPYVAKSIGLTREELEKISAFVIYNDNVESIIGSEFRMLYLNNGFRVIPNKNYVNQDWDTLFRLMKIYKKSEFIIDLESEVRKQNILDYYFDSSIDSKEINNVCYKVADIFYSDMRLYSGIIGPPFSNEYVEKMMNSQRRLVRDTFA